MRCGHGPKRAEGQQMLSGKKESREFSRVARGRGKLGPVVNWCLCVLCAGGGGGRDYVGGSSSGDSLGDLGWEGNLICMNDALYCTADPFLALCPKL